MEFIPIMRILFCNLFNLHLKLCSVRIKKECKMNYMKIALVFFIGISSFYSQYFISKLVVNYTYILSVYIFQFNSTIVTYLVCLHSPTGHSKTKFTSIYLVYYANIINIFVRLFFGNILALKQLASVLRMNAQINSLKYFCSKSI